VLGALNSTHSLTHSLGLDIFSSCGSYEGKTNRSSFTTPMTAQYRYGTIIKTLTKEKKRTLLVAVTSITGGSRNFERQRISPVVNYRKCTQRSKCLSCGKRRFIAKKNSEANIWAAAPANPIRIRRWSRPKTDYRSCPLDGLHFSTFGWNEKAPRRSQIFSLRPYTGWPRKLSHYQMSKKSY